MENPRTLLKAVLLCLACLAGLGQTGQAQAQTCTASATAMAFGTYDPKSSLPISSTANVTIVCQATVALLVAYTVKLSAGGSGNLLARRMITSGSQLNYQVYKDATFTQVWGDGTSSTGYNVGGYLLSVLVPVSTTYIAYGQITALQNVFAGVYTDTLTILVTY